MSYILRRKNIVGGGVDLSHYGYVIIYMELHETVRDTMMKNKREVRR